MDERELLRAYDAHLRTEAEVLGAASVTRVGPLWVAEAGAESVSAGRMDPVAGTPFASPWGGAALPEQRGRGIYRALTAARAALALGRTLMHSDSTERSRPILERSGLVEVPTTTRYVWQRAGAQPT